MLKNILRLKYIGYTSENESCYMLASYLEMKKRGKIVCDFLRVFFITLSDFTFKVVTVVNDSLKSLSELGF